MLCNKDLWTEIKCADSTPRSKHSDMNGVLQTHKEPSLCAFSGVTDEFKLQGKCK